MESIIKASENRGTTSTSSSYHSTIKVPNNASEETVKRVNYIKEQEGKNFSASLSTPKSISSLGSEKARGDKEIEEMQLKIEMNKKLLAQKTESNAGGVNTVQLMKQIDEQLS